MKKLTSQQIINSYQQQADGLIAKMYQVFVRAQRKVDDEAYYALLKKMDAKK